MGLLQHVVTGITVAVAVLLCLLPPGNRVVYHYYSTYWPPARAGKVTSLVEAIPTTFAVSTALKLDLFNKIYDHGSATFDEIAKEAELDPRATEILLNALVAADILQVTDGGKKYELTGSAEHHLLQRQGENFLGFFFSIIDHQLEIFSHLPEAMKKGGSQSKNPGDHVGHPFWLQFATGTREFSLEPARFLTTTVDNWARRKSQLRILDVACGSGAYGYTFAKAYEGSKVDFTDGPGVLEKTKANAEFFGVKMDENRFKFIPGDIFVDKIAEPETYDIVVISHFYHHFNKSVNSKLTKKLASFLKKDGRLVVNDFVTENRPSMWERPFPRIFSLIMLANTREGQSYPVDAFHEWFDAAGLTHGPVAPHPYAPITAVVGVKA